MKNQEFFITEESFSRAKKQLKKALKNEGLDISLSKSANLIAKSFGFNDEHQIQSFINNQLKSRLVIFDDFPFYYNITEEESLYFKEIIKIWSIVSEYLKENISIIMKNISNFENGNILSIIKNINDTINTSEYMINNNASIMHGNISLRDSGENIYAMAITRHRMLELSKITLDNKYRYFYELMDAYHNIEKYFYLSHDERKEFWLQPKDFKSESRSMSIGNFNI